MLRLYDTAQRAIVDPAFGNTVRIYICGITPYDSAHLGHAFTFLTYDVLQRYLEHRGITVTIVRNITDVDEPMYSKAGELGVPYLQLADEETAKFQSVMERLSILPPAAEPRASHYIMPMATAVQQLLERGAAYQLANGDIYYATAKDPGFGSLFHLPERLQYGFMAARGGDPERTDKQHPLDFLLWKAVADVDDPARWETPAGIGRPGWHIECTVMSSDLLGVPFDIHGGGMDLIYPHHEAESAQARGLGHPTFAKHWMHVAPLSYRGEKMSKSLGNLVFAGDLLTHNEPAAVRLALLGYHYRVGGEWLDSCLDDASVALQRIKKALTQPHSADPAPYLTQFYAALEHDLNTPEAVRVMLAFVDKCLDNPGNAATQHVALKTMTNLLGLEV